MLADSADSDKMQHYAAFYLDLHCLPQYPFRGFQYRTGSQQNGQIMIINW